MHVELKINDESMHLTFDYFTTHPGSKHWVCLRRKMRKVDKKIDCSKTCDASQKHEEEIFQMQLNVYRCITVTKELLRNCDKFGAFINFAGASVEIDLAI